MENKQAGSVSYVPELDGMRAFAVLAVLMSHYGLGETFARFSHSLPWGLMGVWAFFVLSGFLITNILYDCRFRLITHEAKFGETLRAFYIRRFLRIFPIYYATLIVVYVFGDPAFQEVVGFHTFFLSNTYSAIYVSGIESNGLVHPESGHLWSLSVEEQFYAIWPFFILLIPRQAILPVAISMILLAPFARAFIFLLGHHHAILYLPTCVDALGFGAILAIIRSETGNAPKILSHQPTIIIASAFCMVCIFLLFSGIAYRFVMVAFPTAAAFLFAALINALLEQRVPNTGRILRFWPLIWVGKISYGIYLLHTFIANWTIALLPEIDALAGPVRFLALTSTTVLVCTIIWYIFERPINNLKHHWPYLKQGR